MRSVAIAGQLVTILVVEHGFGVDLPVGPMLAVLAALAVVNVLTCRALRAGHAVSDRALAAQLLLDVAALAVQLALAGGGGNPFVGMFVLPLVITAACLPWNYTALVAAVAIACHAALMFRFRPLFPPGAEARHMELMTLGLWVNTSITAGMVAFFVERIATGWRASERALCAAREREIRNEYIVRIGALAGGAAHELAQPLGTLTLLMSELEDDYGDRPGSRELMRQARQQLSNFREMLGSLLQFGRATVQSPAEVQAVDSWLRDRLETFRTRVPGASVTLSIDSPGPVPHIRHDLALRQALLNLLGNAADVSPQWIALRASWDEEQVTLSVLDRGPGLSPEVAKEIGKMFFTTKPAGAGNGLGLNLAHTAVARLGGALEIFNAPEGGACAQIVLPIAPAASEAAAPSPRPQAA